MTSPPAFVTPPNALILSTSTSAERIASIRLASQILNENGLVAFPTETVYGLGASALSEIAVKKIFAAKGRPSDNPLIVHISNLEMLGDLIPGGLGNGVCQEYEALMKRFWPGPLSLIFNLENTLLESPKKVIAKAVRAGAPSVAMRMPQHPLALELIETTALPLAAPSANLSSRPSPTRAQHVIEDLGEGRGVGAIIDGGSCQVGVESTVVDYFQPLSSAPGQIRILRAGGVSAEEIESCLIDAGFKLTTETEKILAKVQVFNRDFNSVEMEKRPTTPGMKYKHYSPTNSKVVLVRSSSTSTNSLDEVIQSYSVDEETGKRRRIGMMLSDETIERNFSSESLHKIVSVPSSSSSLVEQIDVIFSYSIGTRDHLLQAAQRLFAGLRFLDEINLSDRVDGSDRRIGVDIILLECVEEKGVGLAVMERSRKAAGGQVEPIEFAS